jgi:hypothetical protein
MAHVNPPTHTEAPARKPQRSQIKTPRQNATANWKIMK